jgi:hypothetical protein
MSLPNIKKYPYDDSFPNMEAKLKGQFSKVRHRMKNQEAKCNRNLRHAILDSNHRIKKMKYGQILSITMNDVVPKENMISQSPDKPGSCSSMGSLPVFQSDLIV